MSEPNPNSFNLVTDPWIPILKHDGEFKRVGILEALTTAHDIRQIAASNPMDRVAVIRFLLAVLYWSTGGPPEGWDGGTFSSTWFDKLEENRSHFNLVGEGDRFFQYRKDGDKFLSVNYLFHEIPTGTNTWHFSHATEFVDGLCPACCALGLIRLPAFCTSGGAGKSPGINAKPPIYVIPLADNLVKTLILSWVPRKNLGIPAWIKPDLKLPASGEIPLLQGLTWLPRRVWLDDSGVSSGVCFRCGKKGPVINKSVFAGAGSSKSGEGQVREWRDPHVICVMGKKLDDITSLHSRDPLGSPDSCSSQWAEVTQEIIKAHPKHRLFSAVGFSTIKSDKYIDVTETIIHVPDDVGCIERKLPLWRDQAYLLEKTAINRIRKTEAKPNRDHSELKPTLASIRPEVEHRTRRLLPHDELSWMEASENYSPMMKLVADSLSPGFTSRALAKRQIIRSTLPDLRDKPEAESKPARKKGGKR